MDYSNIKENFNIKQITAAELFLPENFESLKYTAYNLMQALDWDGALVFAGSLMEKLSQVSPRDSDQQNLLRALRYWVLRLKLFSYNTLKSGEKSDLFKNNLVEILRDGLDVRKAIFSYLNIFDSPDIIKEETDNLIFLLNDSSEFLGDPRKFPAAAFKPMVANWLKEYQVVLPSSGIQPGAFQIVKFMDSNQYVKYLSSEEKGVLRELLDLYNGLLSPVVYVDQKVDAPSAAYMIEEKFVLPESTQTDLRPPAQRPPPAQVPPAVPNRPAASLLSQSPPPSSTTSPGLPPSPRLLGTGRPPSPQKEREVGAGEEASGNKKTAQLRAVSDGLTQGVHSQSLTDKYSISDSKSLSSDISSGGPDGNRTRETKLSRIGSHPGQAHLESLYHNPPAAQVSVQDILNKKPTAGITFGAALPPQNLTAEVLKKQMEERQKTITSPSLSLERRGMPPEEIDKKLDDLKKRVDKK